MNGELLVLDAGSALPPYEQIVTQLRARIAFGFLHPGQPLPSVRQFARDLGVAPNTVARILSKSWGAGILGPMR